MPVFARRIEAHTIGCSLTKDRKNGVTRGYQRVYPTGYSAAQPGDCRQSERQTTTLKKTVECSTLCS